MINVKTTLGLLTLLIFQVLITPVLAQEYYPADTWEVKSPKELDMDPQELQKAVDFALANEYSGVNDLRIEIKFQNHGIKMLAMEYAKLTKV